MVPLDLGAPFDKYRYHRRVVQEVQYGRLANRATDPQADVLVVCNMPLISLSVIARWARSHHLPFVFWQQDVYSRAMADEAKALLPIGGGALGRGFERMERRVAVTADATVTISPDFGPTLRAWGVPDHQVHVIENWAPLSELPPDPDEGRTWRSEHGLADEQLVVYSGTIGKKHDPGLLVEVARGLPRGARLVVVSEGPGADWVHDQATEQDLPVTVLPFQPIADFPRALAAADVLLAVLEGGAGVFSVPSKILSYHCAGRPIVAAMPTDNLAARTLREAGSGLVVAPDDAAGLVDAVDGLLADEGRRQAMGAAARAHAERAFDVEAVADRFEVVLEQAAGRRAAHR
jgi:glycosyltransferase involved in cell wall biosynthesis